MYQPPAFREEREEVQHALIRSHPLALLISTGNGDINADPLPMILHPEIGAKGVLHCHIAKANLQRESLALNPDALAVFQGAESYISPSWYASKAEHGKVVPTWNYVIVQVRGHARLIEDADWLLQHVSELTQTHEHGRTQPWAVKDAPEKFTDGQLKGIVGIEIAISHIEAKWKVSQNRSKEDQRGVMNGLSESQAEMAELIAKAQKP